MPRGRPVGSKNKIPQAIKAMVEETLDELGGKEYLKRQATEEPAAFLTLVGKCLPKDVNNQHSGEVHLTVVTGVPRETTG